MKRPTTIPTGGTQKVSRKKQEENVSPDGKWRSFPRVPNLLQYVNTGKYFARTKVNGKLIRQTLDTDVFTTAKLRLPDFIKKQQAKRRVEGAPETFGEAQKLYEQDLENDGNVSENSKRYRRYCIQKLNETWPTLGATRLSRVTETECKAWAGRIGKLVDAGDLDEQYFNNMLGTLRRIFKRAGMIGESDPSRDVKRRTVIVPEVTLPTLEQFGQIVREMETSGAGQQQACADFARFLAYSGPRLSEARRVLPEHVDLAAEQITFYGAKMRVAGGGVQSRTRTVPIIPPMRDLLKRLLKDARPGEPLLKVGECEKSLRRACAIVGVPCLTHHKLRDMFATVCIESGVDIPTVADWLGHKDGGALLLKRYRKHREEHSRKMGTKVTFGIPAPRKRRPKRRK